jgi:ribosome-associated translation inhibitor RaiA
MPFITHVSFKNIEPSAALEARIKELADKLEHFYDGIMRCDVMVELPHRSQRQGQPFHVRIHLHVRAPGSEIIVSHDPGDDGAHVDPYVAVRDAFDSAKRQVQSLVERLRGEVKHHSGQPQL